MNSITEMLLKGMLLNDTEGEMPQVNRGKIPPFPPNKITFYILNVHTNSNIIFVL